MINTFIYELIAPRKTQNTQRKGGEKQYVTLFEVDEIKYIYLVVESPCVRTKMGIWVIQMWVDGMLLVFAYASFLSSPVNCSTRMRTWVQSLASLRLSAVFLYVYQFPFVVHFSFPFFASWSFTALRSPLLRHFSESSILASSLCCSEEQHTKHF